MEQGTHHELLEKKGLFAQMWADQVSVTDPELVPLDASVPNGSDSSGEMDINITGDRQPSLISL